MDWSGTTGGVTSARSGFIVTGFVDLRKISLDPLAGFPRCDIWFLVLGILLLLYLAVVQKSTVWLDTEMMMYIIIVRRSERE